MGHNIFRVCSMVAIYQGRMARPECSLHYVYNVVSQCILVYGSVSLLSVTVKIACHELA